jgi:hypothetical protein
MKKLINGIFLPEISLIFALYFLVTGVNAQDQEIHTIDWTTPVKRISESGREMQVLSFEGAFFHESVLPQKFIKIKGEVENLEFSILSAVPLTEAEKSLVPADYHNSSPLTSIYYGIEGRTVYSYVYITPLVTAAGGFSKVEKFSYKINYSKTSRFASSAAANTSSNLRMTAGNANNSVLSSGDWFKLEVSEDGIYKIDYDFLKVLGLADPIDPRMIRIFGNGGGMLPQKNSSLRADDLTENAIFVSGEQDGVFNQGDYILFYAQGPHKWEYNTNTNIFSRSYNLYSWSNYYFLTVGPQQGLRVSEKESLSAADYSVNSYTFYHQEQKDEVNILKSGRLWLGEKFDYKNSSVEKIFPVSGIVQNTGVKVINNVVAASSSASSFRLSANGQMVKSFSVEGISDLFSYTYSTKGIIKYDTVNVPFSYVAGSSDIRLKLDYIANGNSASAYLDYMSVNYQRYLNLYGNMTEFCNPASISYSKVEYQIGQMNAGASIWDITNPVQPVRQKFELNNSQALFRTETGNELRQYVVFQGNSFPTPKFAGKTDNQNLHSIGIARSVPQLLIITSEEFISSAEKLASHRQNFSGMKVEIATVSKIYNEFSSGKQDVTAIRDFIRMVYLRSTPADSLKYVILVGGCSYDYKNRISGNTNFVPVYESRQSLIPVKTYSSDDYFGFMSDPEGEWVEENLSSDADHSMEIGIGRLPANNLSESDAMVNKIIYYDTDKNSRKKWRNKLCFVADDGDTNLHQKDAESLSNKVFKNNPVFNINKIYLDAYPQVSAPGGELSIEAKKLLNLEIEKGVLLVNYTGHGGEAGWAQEKLLEIADINNMRNMENLTFMVTATCEFGRYDDPGTPSGAEFAVRNPQGGVIGLMTTTRPVLSNSNYTINNALYDYIFRKKNGKWMKLGEILKETKNHSKEDVYNRNYSLLGDPSQVLAYPQETIKVTSVNGKDPAVVQDTLKALSKVTITGEIQSGSTTLTNYNGTLYATIFDKPSEITTLGNEGDNTKMRFNLFNNYLYDGKASIKDGKFIVTFIVPKDISYQLDKGKISLYALDEQNQVDAHGYENRVIIGGSAEESFTDNNPPRVRLYLNDETFVNGGATGTDAMLLVKLFDESGINIAGTGIGHEISAILDGEKTVMNLNEYYSATVDNYQEGSIEFPLKDLSPGTHTLRVKAWDTHNNSSESVIEFIVLNEEKLEIRNILNYPNPFTTSTNFHFDHNRTGDDLEVIVQIFTVSGKLIKTLRDDFLNSKSHISALHWDGRDDFGDLIGKGVYVYKLEVRSVRDGSKTNKYQKLVLLK